MKSINLMDDSDTLGSQETAGSVIEGNGYSIVIVSIESSTYRETGFRDSYPMVSKYKYRPSICTHFLEGVAEGDGRSCS